jgi:RND family efflux transporter MFP subunit
MSSVSLERRNPRPRRITLFLACSAVLLASACRAPEEPPPPEIRPVRVLKIEQRAAADTSALTGTVEARTEVNQSFRIDGRLVERYVDVGDLVRPGQLIARLDPQNEESALQGAQAQLSAARAQQVEARNNFNRMRDLVVENAVSRANYEQAESLMKSADAAVTAAQSQVTLAQNRLGYTRLTATVAGVVAARGAEPGEVVGPGRMIVQVAKDGNREAVFDVPAQAKDQALKSPDVIVALTIDPKVTARGRIREVSPRADPITGTFRIRVELLDAPQAMRLGSTVTARVRREGASGYVVPASALVRADRQPAVWLFDAKTQTVAPRQVKVEEFEPGRVVVSSGLEQGDMIVTAGVQALHEGQKVRALEARP